MEQISLKGCGTALVTPFRGDGSVDFPAYEKLVQRQIDEGADFLVALATTGETPTLSPEEKVGLLKLTVKLAAPENIPVVAGVGSNSVPGTLANIRLLEGLGAAAWLVVVPFYNKPTQEGQFLYFKTIAGNSTLPILIYNVPGRTGANMLPQTAIRLSKIDGIIGIKEASGNMEQAKRILEGTDRETFCVLSGDDDMTLGMMRLGAAGAISVASDIAPGKVSGMIHAALEGDFTKAQELDCELRDLYEDCFLESNPIPVKAALSMLGLCRDDMRLPLVPASEKTRSEMRSCLKGLHLL